ncbi:unnamed protein product [Urochloa humidicola]
MEHSLELERGSSAEAWQLARLDATPRKPRQRLRRNGAAATFSFANRGGRRRSGAAAAFSFANRGGRLLPLKRIELGWRRGLRKPARGGPRGSSRRSWSRGASARRGSGGRTRRCACLLRSHMAPPAAPACNAGTHGQARQRHAPCSSSGGEEEEMEPTPPPRRSSGAHRRARSRRSLRARRNQQQQQLGAHPLTSSSAGSSSGQPAPWLGSPELGAPWAHGCG